jgi:MFS family permease
MASLAVVLLVYRATGSYAAAGGAAGVMAIGDAAISPAQGRLIDRFGQRRVLLPSALVYLLVLAALAAAAEADWPPALMIGLAGVGGMAYPPISASMNVLWPVLVGGGALLQTAYALESLIQQTLFFLGPLLVAAFVAVGSPAAAVFATGVFAFAGTLGFVASPASRAWHGGAREPVFGRRSSCSWRLSRRRRHLFPEHRLRGALRRGSRLCLAARQRERSGRAPRRHERWGARRRAGWRVAADIAASRRPLPVAVSAPRRQRRAAAARPFAREIGLLLALSGLFVAPTAAASYVLIDLVSPPGCRTEAFTWMSTAVAAGAALGSVIGGALIDYASVQATLVFAAVSCAAGAAAVFIARQPLARKSRAHEKLRRSGFQAE